MTRTITVNELIKQLTTMQELGMGEAKVWYRDYNSMDWPIEQGVYDTHENNVVLG